MKKTCKMNLYLRVSESFIILILLMTFIASYGQQLSSEKLFEAIKNGWYRETDSLIKSGVKVNSLDEDRITPLMYASKYGQTEIAELLLNKGAKVNLKDVYGWSALMIAAVNGETDIVELLLSKGAWINQKENDSMTALMIAANHGQKDVALLLLKKGAKVNCKSAIKYSKRVIGQETDSKGNLRYITGESIGEGGWTALHLAAGTGNREIVEILIDYKANINARDAKKLTPAGMAKQRGHQAVSDYILSRGGVE